jgi:hypothetical protein
LPQNKMEKGSNAKIYIGWHCYDQNDLSNMTQGSHCCPHNSPVVFSGSDYKSKPLCKYSVHQLSLCCSSKPDNPLSPTHFTHQRESHYVAQAGLKLMILLPHSQEPQCWDYRQVTQVNYLKFSKRAPLCSRAHDFGLE